MEWNKVLEVEMPFGEEVIAFNEKWIDEDFNPNGTRVGFLQDDGFISATWNNEQDCYEDEVDKDFPYVCLNGRYCCCIPYEKNEYLSGTNKAYEAVRDYEKDCDK